jgi:hypothetical protein
MARGSCWVGYEQKGMKKKGNKLVPNCVPAGMKKGGLKEWFRQKWVDIGSKRKDGSFAKCGRSKQRADAKRKYPKCVPLAKARRMTEGQRKSAVARKRAAANVGPKPTNVKTILKRDIGGDVKKPKIKKGKFKVNLFTFDSPKTRYGDNIITAVEDTKVDLDPNINYSRIYKNNIQVDLGISTKGKAGVKIKKVF